MVVSATNDISLPSLGICSSVQAAALLIAANATHGMIAPTSITKHGGLITTSHHCPKPVVFLTAPKLIHYGQDIVFQWRRSTDGHSDLTDVLSLQPNMGIYRSETGEIREDVHLQHGTHAHDWVTTRLLENHD